MPRNHSSILVIWLFLLGAGPARAHIDTLAQVINPDPLVESFEAETLTRIGTTRVIDDPEASGGKAVVLSGPGAGFDVELGKLTIGMHVVFLCGKVTEESAIFHGAELSKKALSGGGTKQRRPLYVHLAVDSAPGGIVEEHRMRVPFTRQYEYMTKIYFHTPEERVYKAKIFLGQRSRVKELIVDRVEVRNPLGNLEFRPVKSNRVMFAWGDIRLLRTSAAKEGKLYDPLRPRPLPPDERARRDELMWNNVMPINANPAQIYGTTFRGNAALAELKKREAEKLGKKLGVYLGVLAILGRM